MPVKLTKNERDVLIVNIRYKGTQTTKQPRALTTYSDTAKILKISRETVRQACINYEISFGMRPNIKKKESQMKSRRRKKQYSKLTALTKKHRDWLVSNETLMN